MDIFLSYSHVDREKVAVVAAYLQRRGAKVWWDAHIGAGQQWREEIGKALADAKCIIVFWSPTAVTSNEVAAETNQAFRRQIFLQTWIDDCDLPPYAYFAEMFQRVDLRGANLRNETSLGTLYDASLRIIENAGKSANYHAHIWQNLDDEAFAKAKRAATRAAAEDYLAAFPIGRHRDEALELATLPTLRERLERGVQAATEQTLSYGRSFVGRVSSLLPRENAVCFCGFPGSGQTTLICAIAAKLVAGSTNFVAGSDLEIRRAHIEPQPDDDHPRFDYEGCLEQLRSGNWPEATRRISRVAVEVEFGSRTGRSSFRSRLVFTDVPGEYTADIALLNRPFADWSAEAWAAVSESKDSLSREFVDCALKLSPTGRYDETVVGNAARLYQKASRRSTVPGGHNTCLGRHLLPGDLEGSPLLSIFPLPNVPREGARTGQLVETLERRYNSYLSHVVRPLVADTVGRANVLVTLVDFGRLLTRDVQGALNNVRHIQRLSAACSTQLQRSLVGASLVRPRRQVLVLTKSDQFVTDQRPRVRDLAKDTFLSTRGAGENGQAFDLVDVAAIESTRQALAENLPVMVGTPLPGERVDEQTMDGKQEIAYFPGDIATPFEANFEAGNGTFRQLRFRPPAARLAKWGTGDGFSGADTRWPDLGVDNLLKVLMRDLL